MRPKTSEGAATVPPRPRTLAERLKWAYSQGWFREGRQRGCRLFQRRMKERAKEIKAEGGSPFEGYNTSSIQGYTSSKVVPSLDFLLEAAAVLKVRREWLILGRGKPTEAEQQVADAAHDLLRRAPGWHPLRSSVREWDDLDASAQAGLLDAWGVLCEGHHNLGEIVGREGPVIETRGQRIAANLVKALAAPLEILELDRGFLPDRSTYLVLTCEALRLYATDVRRAAEEYDREEEVWRTARDDAALQELNEDG